MLLVIVMCHSSTGFIHFYNRIQFSLYNLKTQQTLKSEFFFFSIVVGGYFI